MLNYTGWINQLLGGSQTPQGFSYGGQQIPVAQGMATGRAIEGVTPPAAGTMGGAGMSGMAGAGDALSGISKAMQGYAAAQGAADAISAQQPAVAVPGSITPQLANFDISQLEGLPAKKAVTA